MIRTSTLVSLATVLAAADATAALPTGSATNAPISATAPALSGLPGPSAISPARSQASYLIGRDTWQTIRFYELDADQVLRGLADARSGATSAVPEADRAAIFRLYDAELGDQRRAANTAWLASNAGKPGVRVLPDGVQYEVLAASSATAVQVGEGGQVSISYTGSLLDGTVFDASVRHGGSATFAPSAVVPGWGSALRAMRKGERWRVWVPPERAYAERGEARLGIPPHALLVIETSLEEVIPAPSLVSPKP